IEERALLLLALRAIVDGHAVLSLAHDVLHAVPLQAAVLAIELEDQEVAVGSRERLAHRRAVAIGLDVPAADAVDVLRLRRPVHLEAPTLAAGAQFRQR